MNHKGWLRVVAIIIPYLLIGVGFQIIGALIGNISWEDGYERTTSQDLVMSVADLLGTFLVLWLFMRFVDKERFIELGFQTRNRGYDFLIGIFIGLVIMAMAYFMLLLFNQITFLRLSFEPLEIFYSLLIFLIVAIVEEALFRGYILKNLMVSFNKYLALFISSLLFALAHGANPNISAFSLSGLFLAGMVLGISYLYTRNLWFPIAYHLSWNLFQTYFGFNVSGQDFYSIVEFSLPVENIINGGAFGFEGSVFSLIIEFSLLVMIFWYYEKKVNSILQKKEND